MTHRQGKNNEVAQQERYYSNTPLSRELMAVGLAHCPKLLMQAAEFLIPCIIGSFLDQIGIEVCPDLLVNMCPC